MKYMGSKFRIAPHIAQYINNIALCENIEDYYEPFMGGCSVGEIVRVKNKHLSDINKPLVELFKKVQEGMWEYKYIDREEWYKVKDDRFNCKVYPEWFIAWCGIGCSFRGRYFSAHGGKYIDKASNKEVDPQLQTYKSLIKERDKILNIKFSHRRYNEIEKPYHAVIYCDAPYRNTTAYNGMEKFNFEEYDEWLIEMSKDNLVLISEYSMIGKHNDMFIELDNWKLNKSIGAGQTDCEETTERLYYVKDGWLTDKYFNDEQELDF